MAESTRERIIREATRLFAAQGIKSTTVAQIEEAVGLRKGSGGVHRYFTTKDDLVRDVLETQLTHSTEAAATATGWDRPTPDAVPKFLTQLGRLMLSLADENREVALIMLREAHNLPPGVLEDLESRNLDVAYTSAAAAIRASQEAAGIDDLDADAIAFLVVAPLVYYRLIVWATGRKILDLDDDRVIASWVDTFSPVFTRLAGGQ